jgi:hypothetical protein
MKFLTVQFSPVSCHFLPQQLCDNLMLPVYTQHFVEQSLYVLDFNLLWSQIIMPADLWTTM